LSSRFGILYESTLARGPYMAVEATPPLAELYERVHFIGHAQYDPSISEYGMKEKAEEIQADLQSRTKYAVLLKDIKVTHYPPYTTDVDFILDVPVESPIAPLAIVAIIVALGVILAFIVWLFWTTWVEKEKKYYCDQETPPSEFDGWLQYVAHLAARHPTKYNAVKESETRPWWEAIPKAAQWITYGIIAAGALTVLVALVPAAKEVRREEAYPEEEGGETRRRRRRYY